MNALISLAADFCWAYATLLTSPLAVTVGLSLSIPLSLIGQMLLNSQIASIAHWIGAAVIILSFVVVSHETSRVGIGNLDNVREPPPRYQSEDDEVRLSQ